MSKYPKLEDCGGVDIDIENEVLRFACCDCGLVHTIAFAMEDDDNLGVAFKREVKATAQLRRYKFGSLHNDNQKWELVLKRNKS